MALLLCAEFPQLCLCARPKRDLAPGAVRPGQWLNWIDEPVLGSKPMLMEVRFYQLSRTSQEEALAKLLSLTLTRGFRAWVRLSDREPLKPLSQALWAHGGDYGFLPHGNVGEDHDADQPILFCQGETAPSNGAAFGFWSNAYVSHADPDQFAANLEQMRIQGGERLILLFDAQDQTAVTKARNIWKVILGIDAVERSFWQQESNGSWVKAA